MNETLFHWYFNEKCFKCKYTIEKVDEDSFNQYYKIFLQLNSLQMRKFDKTNLLDAFQLNFPQRRGYVNFCLIFPQLS